MLVPFELLEISLQRCSLPNRETDNRRNGLLASCEEFRWGDHLPLLLTFLRVTWKWRSDEQRLVTDKEFRGAVSYNPETFHRHFRFQNCLVS